MSVSSEENNIHFISNLYSYAPWEGKFNIFMKIQLNIIYLQTRED